MKVEPCTKCEKYHDAHDECPISQKAIDAEQAARYKQASERNGFFRGARVNRK